MVPISIEIQRAQQRRRVLGGLAAVAGVAVITAGVLLTIVTAKLTSIGIISVPVYGFGALAILGGLALFVMSGPGDIGDLDLTILKASADVASEFKKPHQADKFQREASELKKALEARAS